MYLKHFASVLIFLDHGHISKIRTGNPKSIKKENNHKKRSFNKNKRNYRKKNKRKGEGNWIRTNWIQLEECKNT